MKNDKIVLLNDNELAAIKGGNPTVYYWAIQVAIALLNAYYSTTEWSISVGGYKTSTSYINVGDTVTVKRDSVGFEIKIGNN